MKKILGKIGEWLGFNAVYITIGLSIVFIIAGAILDWLVDDSWSTMWVVGLCMLVTLLLSSNTMYIRGGSK